MPDWRNCFCLGISFFRVFFDGSIEIASRSFRSNVTSDVNGPGYYPVQIRCILFSGSRFSSELRKCTREASCVWISIRINLIQYFRLHYQQSLIGIRFKFLLLWNNNINRINRFFYWNTFLLLISSEKNLANERNEITKELTRNILYTYSILVNLVCRVARPRGTGNKAFR